MIKSKFSITMRCNKYKKDTIQAEEDKLDPVKVDLELYLGEEDAKKFIFKQSPIAFFVDKYEITEELTRLNSHILQFFHLNKNKKSALSKYM